MDTIRTTKDRISIRKYIDGHPKESAAKEKLLCRENRVHLEKWSTGERLTRISQRKAPQLSMSCGAFRVSDTAAACFVRPLPK